MLSHFIKISLIFSLTLFCSKAFGQIDTVAYIKEFDAHKTEYIGQNFNKLYRKLKVKPESFLHSLNTYSSSTTFFYKKKNLELRIEWIGSPYSQINKNVSKNCGGKLKCILSREIKKTLNQFRVKNIQVTLPGEYFMPFCIGQLKPVKSISKFVNDRLSNNSDSTKEMSFVGLLIKIRPLQPVMTKNIIEKKNKISASHIKFAFSDKRVSRDTITLEIKWEHPIKYRNLKGTKSEADTVFTDYHYNLYWGEKIKNIEVSK